MAILIRVCEADRGDPADVQRPNRLNVGSRPTSIPWLGEMWGIALIVMMLVVGWPTPSVRAGGEAPTEYQIKAAFLYNFAKFVEWPSSVRTGASDSIVIGILGKDPFADDLDRMINGKSIKGKKLVVKRFPTRHDLEPCQILFISASEERELGRILASLNRLGVLTVGEVDRFASRGGIVNFYLEKRKVRFEINVDAAHRAGLKISSKLLRLARVIRDDDAGEKD